MDFSGFNSFKMLMLSIVVYIWYTIYITMPFCFSSWLCFFSMPSILNFALIILYSYLAYGFLKLIIKDEKLDNRIKLQTEENLKKDNELKILEKQKLELEIAQLENKSKKPKKKKV